MYGSSFCRVTRRPRAFSSRPSDDAASPLPSPLATPPVTNTCFVTRAPVVDAGPSARDHRLPRLSCHLADPAPIQDPGPVDQDDRDGQGPGPVVEPEQQPRAEVQDDGGQGVPG